MRGEPARLVLADPPWQHDDALGKRGAKAHYRNVMPVDEIARYALPPLAAEGCMLLLWRLASMQEEALFVVRAWGFRVKSEIVWDKVTAKQSAPCECCGHAEQAEFFGMGRYVRASHETCLVATRGRVQVDDHAIRSRFTAPVREHSRKPDELYGIAEALVAGGPYVELFARHRRRGWRSVGNELPPARNVVFADPRQMALPEIA